MTCAWLFLTKKFCVLFPKRYKLYSVQNKYLIRCPEYCNQFRYHPQVRPLEHPERLSTPSPKCSPVQTRKSSSAGDKSSRNKSAPRSCAPSLTTITEEPSWHSSGQSAQSSMQSIVVQPEVVVETTTYNGSDSNSGRSTPTKTSHSGAITTKVRTAFSLDFTWYL